MATKLRINTDTSTVDVIIRDDESPYVKAEAIIATGVWDRPTRLLPPHRIISIEILEL